MLAQNFKPPADLGVSNKEFDALLKVLGMLERGELQHAKPNAPIPNGFNMAKITNDSKCGTVLCIAGWAMHINGDRDFPYMEMTAAQNAEMRSLIMPPGDWGKYTPAHGAIALRNYLTHGEARWEEALAE